MTDSGRSPMRFVVIGSGKTPIDVARALRAQDGVQLVALFGDPRRETPQSSLRAAADRLSLPYHATSSLSAPETVESLRAAEPDYVISANNFLIFRRAALDVPKIATINFHNGPLPQYAGLNPGSWALINGERRYGISWHLVDEGIDAGGVLVSRMFDVDDGETAVSLVIKGIQAGLASFKTELLPRLLRRDLDVLPQNFVERRYYSGKERPYDGLLPWWLPRDPLDALVRALTFAPLRNLFYRPRLVLPAGGAAYCERIDYEPDAVAAEPGLILDVDASKIRVAAARGVLAIEGLFAVDGEPITASHVLATGQTLRRD